MAFSDREHAIFTFNQSLERLADESFTNEYEQSPELTEQARQQADEAADGILEMHLEAHSEQGNPETRSSIHKAAMKFFFIFNRLESPVAEDHLDRLAFGKLFMSTYLETEENLQETANGLNRYANYIAIVYLDQAKTSAGVLWDMLNINEKFWLVDGFVRASVPHDFSATDT
jgi:hypothetical protein